MSELTQNEIFQLTGHYPPLSQTALEPVVPLLSPETQLMVLRRNIRRCGLRRTAEAWKDYPDPYIRSALKLAASGMDASLIKNLIGTAVFAEEKAGRRGQLDFNNRILDILFMKTGGE